LTPCILDETLRPYGIEVIDEDTFNVAMSSSPEMRTWVEQTLTTLRLRNAAERIAECVAARVWVVKQGGPHVAGDLATLDAYAASFDEKGFTNLAHDLRRRAFDILHEMTYGTRH
jgi:hypothetical protein